MKSQFDLKKDIRDWWSARSDKQKKIHKLELAYMAFSILALFSPLFYPFSDAFGFGGVSSFGIFAGAILAAFLGLVLLVGLLFALRRSGFINYGRLLHSFSFVAFMSWPVVVTLIAPIFFSVESLENLIRSPLIFIPLISLAIAYWPTVTLFGMLFRPLVVLVGVPGADLFVGLDEGLVAGFGITTIVMASAYLYYGIFTLASLIVRKLQVKIKKIRAAQN